MIAFGINHRTSPVSLREQLVFQPAELPAALQTLASALSIPEALILSTCNRTEIYAIGTEAPQLAHWLSDHKKIPSHAFQTHCYTHHHARAIRHAMRVASGLDSMVLGEPQVFGQIKRAYTIAEKAGMVGAHFKQLFPAIFASGKAIRTRTDIGTHPVSLAYIVMQIGKKILGELTNARVLLIGAGEITRLIATHLHDSGVTQLSFANRHPEKLRAIAKAMKTTPISLDKISECIHQYDLIITATASQQPILTKPMFETLERDEKNPLLLVDLAVPRDVSNDIGTLSHIHLYNLDQLQSLINDNLKKRQSAITQAEQLIDCHLAQLQKKLHIFQTRDVITQYRSRLEKIRDTELEKATKLLERGHAPDKVLEKFGKQLINKIMHHPTVKLRESATAAECALLQNIKNFFEV